ncbi:hypothetical protein O7626_32725 [Micromonospora sp. WMMD1102]|uniref:hypothetical protein n=1 Tax=Micromonospora sp. WMMD1102 TaxID=3016105 RepID=UPI0024157667|nr:hypothetical protein [Micromonospora sp. WMMD1102]MDG4790625.1 hypothetical protein [Micromonospora sp. WMMD1102]
MTVIELGEERYDPPAAAVPSRRWRRRRLRTAGLALAGVLVLGAGGAAAPAPPEFTEIYQGRLGGATHLLTADRFFVAEPVTEDLRRVSAYELTRGRLLWSGTYPVEQPEANLYLAGDLLMLVDGAERTMLLDSGTGQPRWSVPEILRVVAAPADRHRRADLAGPGRPRGHRRPAAGSAAARHPVLPGGDRGDRVPHAPRGGTGLAAAPPTRPRAGSATATGRADCSRVGDPAR